MCRVLITHGQCWKVMDRTKHNMCVSFQYDLNVTYTSVSLYLIHIGDFGCYNRWPVLCAEFEEFWLILESYRLDKACKLSHTSVPGQCYVKVTYNAVSIYEVTLSAITNVQFFVQNIGRCWKVMDRIKYNIMCVFFQYYLDVTYNSVSVYLISIGVFECYNLWPVLCAEC